MAYLVAGMAKNLELKESIIVTGRAAGFAIPPPLVSGESSLGGAVTGGGATSEEKRCPLNVDPPGTPIAVILLLSSLVDSGTTPPAPSLASNELEDVGFGKLSA